MSQRNMRYTYIGTNDVRFADPQNILNTLRITRNLAKRRSSTGVSYQGVASEVISNRVVNIGPECQDVCKTSGTEVISVRTRISGSIENQAEVLQVWLDHRAAIDLVIADLAIGFLPGATTEFPIEVAANEL